MPEIILKTAVGREKDVLDIDVHGRFEKLVVTLLVMRAFSTSRCKECAYFRDPTAVFRIMAQLLESHGFTVQRRFGLGGALICCQALVNGEIDVYAEYSGTLLQAILKKKHLPSGQSLNDVLRPLHIETLPHLGFNNTYALALKRELAQARNIESIGDLKDHPDLTVALSHELLNRSDGWPGLKQAYALPFTPVGIEHGLAYKAIDQQQIDITDAYSTDGDLERYALATLVDPQAYFPEYLAMPLMRSAQLSS